MQQALHRRAVLARDPAADTSIVEHVGKPKHVALYVRCSTEEQTTENQVRELRAVAERHGWIGFPKTHR